MKKEKIDPRVIEKNEKIADNMIRKMKNEQIQKCAKMKKRIYALAKNGNVNAVYDLFNEMIRQYPAVGKYKFCKGCEADTPHIDGVCAICGE